MKFVFNSNLEHQTKAIDAVIKSFDGISLRDGSEFTIKRYLSLFNDAIGYGNSIPLNNWQQILDSNVKKIQEDACLEITGVDIHNPTLDIEMETGTGKTYVFLRTIFELNKKYGFKKFIIVVPSIAIREGVKKTFEMTKEHFKSLYNNVNYNFFEYNSKKMNEIFSFAKNNSIEIMISVIGSINKITNVFGRESESLSGYSALDLIKENRPIVIIDEPQSTASGKKSVEAIQSLNPLFTLRYSATFNEKNNKRLIYKLDAVDAYNSKLVKEIYIDSSSIENKKTNDIELVKIINNKAYLEIQYDGKKHKGFFEIGDNVLSFLNNISKNIKILEINKESVKLSTGETLSLNESEKYYNFEVRKRQIKNTIEIHLKNQIAFQKKNVKVLSLFFIDKVDKYKIFNEKTNSYELGEYGQYFERALKEIILSNEEYKTFYGIDEANADIQIKRCHNGYFSKYKKTEKLYDSKGNLEDDALVYDLIMKDKEKLLSFENPVSFIFSHSALREGWDNPNVFQICTLNQTDSTIKKRQEIGRGLRICVDQNGNRIHDENINKLTVVINENYKSFLESYQKDLKESGIDFGKIKRNVFENIKVNGTQIGAAESGKIFDVLTKLNWIDKNEEISENFIFYCDSNNGFINELEQEAIQELKQHLPNHSDEFYKNIFRELENKAKTKNIIKNVENNKKLSINKETLNSKEFKKLWEAINKKTTYYYEFDSEPLIQKAIKEINSKISDYKNNIVIKTTKGTVDFSEDGIILKDKSYSIHAVDSKKVYSERPDIVRNTMNETELTRNTVIRIIKESELYNFFLEEPYDAQKFLIETLKPIVERTKIEGVKYEVIPDKDYPLSSFEDELNDNNNEINVDRNAQEIDEKYKNKTVYNIIKLDSNVEKEFLNDALANDYVNKIIKFPSWFYIDTPVGEYYPDWAIYNKYTQELVVETKGTSNESELRTKESDKIKCARLHFEAINKAYGTDIKFRTVNSLDELIRKV